MKRKKFIAAGFTMISVIPLVGFNFFQNNNSKKPQWLLDWIKINDKNINRFKAIKVTDPNSKYFGGYMNDAEIPNPQTTSGFINRACSLISCSESIHYKSDSLLSEIEAAAKCLVEMQHSDGTIDLLETNFHSTPDTAFVLENIIPAYRFITKANINNSEKTINYLKQFLLKAGEALIVGGIHTPNHRWVVSASLAKLNENFPDIRYVNRIEQWLNEYIDIDPDGQYTEKSTNSYSPIVNRALIDIAVCLKKPALYEYVRKNLNMTFYYVHPNGEVVTEASNRQDKNTIANMLRYYYCYKYMAIHDNNGQFAEMVKLIERTSTLEQLAGYLEYFLPDEKLWVELPIGKALPVNYAKVFPYSGVVRIRRGNWDSTILANNAGFLTFQKDSAVLTGIRFASSFFGKGQFMSEKILQKEDYYILTQNLEGPYFQPIDNKYIDADGDWEKMPRINRKQSEVQKLEYVVKVKELKAGIEIEININGTGNVPVTVELIFRKGGQFDGVTKFGIKENTYLLENGTGTYTVGNDTITFGPGKILHKTLQLRGTLPFADAPTVYLTGFTPFNHKINIY